jgi:hypothetical protein
MPDPVVEYVSFDERRRPRDALIATEITPSLAASA